MDLRKVKMTRKIDTAVYPNIQQIEKPTSSNIKHLKNEGISKFSIPESLDIIIKNTEKNHSETGRIFVPKMEDEDRIYAFMENSIPKMKVLDYTKPELYRLISNDINIVSCVENTMGEIVGINIAYPAKLLPIIAPQEKWYPEGGFSDQITKDNYYYNELIAVSPQYQNNGLGKILRSKQVFDVVNRKSTDIVLYSIPEAYNINLNYGFKDGGKTIIKFYDDDSKAETYFMRLKITKEILHKAHSILEKYHRR